MYYYHYYGCKASIYFVLNRYCKWRLGSTSRLLPCIPSEHMSVACRAWCHPLWKPSHSQVCFGTEGRLQVRAVRLTRPQRDGGGGGLPAQETPKRQEKVGGWGRRRHRGKTAAATVHVPTAAFPAQAPLNFDLFQWRVVIIEKRPKCTQLIICTELFSINI